MKTKNYTSLYLELKQLEEKAYKDFNYKIIPTQQEVIGIRVPILRKIAKQISKENPESFLNLEKNNCYELIMLEGMVISQLKLPIRTLLDKIEQFLEKVDSWAQVDVIISNIKQISKFQSESYSQITKWLDSDNEFIVRAGLVALLCFYTDENWLDFVFELSQNIKHKGYYVVMGNAWLLSTCMAKFPEKTLEFFEENKLNSQTQNKAIQKSIESLRVSDKNKAILRKLKKKDKTNQTINQTDIENYSSIEKPKLHLLKDKQIDYFFCFRSTIESAMEAFIGESTIESYLLEGKKNIIIMDFYTHNLKGVQEGVKFILSHFLAQEGFSAIVAEDDTAIFCCLSAQEESGNPKDSSISDVFSKL